jgi:hypothetical protein
MITIIKTAPIFPRWSCGCALETILAEKGYVETAALDRIVELYESKIGPHIGAQVIAKA